MIEVGEEKLTLKKNQMVFIDIIRFIEDSLIKQQETY